MKKSSITLSIILAVALIVVLCGYAIAKVTGRCDNCHTMHNSQGGVDLYANPYDVLLKGDCVGCHSRVDSSTTYSLGTSTVPVVNYTGGDAPTKYLAGGNFYWVAKGADAKGHNVLGIASQDIAITGNGEFAPGSQYDCANSCHFSLADPISGQNEALNGGCQGCHLKVRHHANDGTGTKYVDSEEGGWYRFLAKHTAGPVENAGVIGIEDEDWQATVNVGDHNEYLGVPVAKTGSTTLTNGSMTAFCCGCHGNFHIEQNSSGDWIRHPSDFVIPTIGEYADMSLFYDPLTPLARPATDLIDLAGAPSGDVAAGTDMVMCLSCHRPHGSPYDDLLRWNYADMIAGSDGAMANKGCFYCHTTKDAG